MKKVELASPRRSSRAESTASELSSGWSMPAAKPERAPETTRMRDTVQPEHAGTCSRAASARAGAKTAIGAEPLRYPADAQP